MEAEQPLSNKTFVAECAISTMSSLCWSLQVNLENSDYMLNVTQISKIATIC